jgi:NAD(P)-dependent dehydrogenase (short-subunit alcohol dehydrogenase family)
MLSNKVILIVGANGLIAREVITHLLEEDAKIVALDLEYDANFIQNYDSTDIALEKGSLNDYATIKKIFEKYNDINAVVNLSYPRNENYGKILDDVSLQSFNDNLTLLTGSSFSLMKNAYEHYKRNNFKISFINFSSIYGVVPPKFEIYDGSNFTMPVEYAAAKSAIISLTKYFANYVNSHNFKINCISPGGVYAGQNDRFIDCYTARTYGGGLVPIEKIANLVIFLISDSSDYINGQNLVIDDGFTNK